MKKFLAFLISALIPIAAVAVGISMLLSDIQPTASFLITFFLIPAFCIGLIALVIFKFKNAFAKIVMVIVILAFFVISSVETYIFGRFEAFRQFENEEAAAPFYTQFCEGYSTMPTLIELGDYSEVEYYYYFSQTLSIFTYDAFTLIAHYDAESYEAEKRALDENYFFQEGEMIGYDNNNCLPTAQIGDYNFRALDTTGEHYPDYEIDHPKKLVLISTNDAERTISYTAFFDGDLDYILSLEEFLLTDCGWKYIIDKKK